MRRGVCCAKMHGKHLETFKHSCISYRDRALTLSRLEEAVRALRRHCGSWRQANSDEVVWLAGGTGEGADGLEPKVDVWSLL